MTDEWNDPIEQVPPISIDNDGCIVVGMYTGTLEVRHRETGRKSRIHSVNVLEGCVPREHFSEGDECRFWGCYDLDEKLRRVLEGSKVRIAYGGMQKLSGGRDMKVFDVRTAKSDEREPPHDERNPPPPETPF